MSMKILSVTAACCSLVLTSAMTTPTAKPSLSTLPSFQKPSIQRPPQFAPAAAAALLPALPVAAVGDASDLDGLVPVLTGGIGLFTLVIGYYGLQAAAEVGSQAEERCAMPGAGRHHHSAQATMLPCG